MYWTYVHGGCQSPALAKCPMPQLDGLCMMMQQGVYRRHRAWIGRDGLRDGSALVRVGAPGLPSYIKLSDEY